MAKKELTLEEILNISYDDLSVLVYGQAEIDPGFHKKVEKLTLKGDQKVLTKNIKKEIASIRRGASSLAIMRRLTWLKKWGASSTTLS